MSDTVLLDVCGVTIVTFRDCDLLNNRLFFYFFSEFDAEPQDCVFIGDDPRWDFVGPKAFGVCALKVPKLD